MTGLIVFPLRKEIGWNIMSKVINAVKNRNLPLIAFYSDIFSINN